MYSLNRTLCFLGLAVALLSAPAGLAAAANKRPVANADAYTGSEGTLLAVNAPGVLGNDTDQDGDALLAIVATQPTNGVLTLSTNGSFTYEPAAGFIGTDRFTYRAHDAQTSSSPATVTLTINARPVVISSGARNTTNCVGEAATFSVSATGTAPLAYQWYFGNTLLTGKTNNSLTLANVQPSDAGTYRVVITNRVNVLTNSATLTVPAPVTATALGDEMRAVGANVVFETTASGSEPISYTWRRDGAVIPGQTDRSLVLMNLETNDTATYSVVVSGPCNSVTNSARLVVSDCFPALDVMLVIDRSGSMSGQPYRDAKTAASNFVNNLYFIPNADQAGIVSYSSSATLNRMLTNNAQAVRSAIGSLPNAGGYTSISSGIQTAQNELSSPRQRTNALPVLVLFTDGKPTDTDTPSNALAQATLAKNAGTLIFTVGLGDVDHDLMRNMASSTNNYFYTANSSDLTALFNAVSERLCRPPTNIFLSGPANSTVCAGGNASFSVLATGCEKFRYQWRHNGALLPGQTNATLSLANVQAANAGVYSVEVMSICQNKTNSAVLTVNEAAAITSATVSGPGFVGSNVTFTAEATGTALSYQWLRGGNVIGTASTLTLQNLTTNDAGTYCVVVASAVCGAPVTNCVTLIFENRAPVANNDSYTTAEDAVLTVGAPGVLGNDTDVDGDTLSAVLVTGPPRGVLTLNANGSFTYRPNTNFFGIDTFTYRAHDTKTNSDIATVTITVTPVNDPPVANNDSFSVTSDTVLTVSAPGVLGNDTDVENDPLTSVLVNGPASGTLTLNANGSFTYTPNTNFHGTDSFTYRAHDGQTSSAPATVTITVVPVPVVIVTPPTGSTNCPGETTGFSVTATGTALTYQWLFGTNLLAGQTNSALVLSNLTALEAGLYCVVVNGATGGPLTNCAELVVNSNVVVTTPPQNQVVCEQTTATFTVGASGTGLVYQWQRGGTALAQQTNASLVLSNVTLADAGTYLVVVSGTCGVSITNTATLTVNQNVVVTAPAVNQIGFVGSNVTFTVGATGTGLLYQWFFNGTLLGSTSNVLTLNNLATNQAGTYCVVVSGTCGAPLTNCVTLIFENRAPVANNDSYTTAEDAVLTVGAPGVLGNDVDVDGDTLSAVLVTGPTRGVLTLNANGSFTYRPNTNFFGIDTFTYRAHDTQAHSDIATVTITVTPVNDPPVTGAKGDSYSVLEDQTLTVAAPGVLENDTDVENDPLTAVLVSGPSHGTLTLNANGSFTYTPATNFYGADNFTYRAHDGQASSAPATVNITVIPVNDAPSFTTPARHKVNRGLGLQTVPNWAREIRKGPPNEDWQSLTFTLVNDNPEFFTVEPAISPEGTLTFSALPSVSGIVTVTAILRDNGGTEHGGVDTSAPVTFEIVVNEPPIVSIANPTNGAVFLHPAVFSVVIDAFDGDGPVTNVQVFANGALLTNLTAAPFYFVWSNVVVGSYALLATATDDCGLMATSEVVNIRVATNVIAATGRITRNRQTGLFEQFVTVSNHTSEVWANGVRLFVHGIRLPDRVWNATGTNGSGAVYLDLTEPVAPGGSNTFVIEYYLPEDRVVPNPMPTLVAMPLPYERNIQPPQITRIEPLDEVSWNLHFTTAPACLYLIQHTEDFVTWTTEPGVYRGNGDPVISPQTATQAKRFYRVLMLP
jgi:large repetitive protein